MSKELEAFKILLKQLFPNYNVDVSFDDICNLNANLDIIRTALKVLEIIKIVCPNIFWVMRTYTYEEYKKKCPDDTLLQQEYNLLREVLL